MTTVMYEGIKKPSYEINRGYKRKKNDRVSCHSFYFFVILFRCSFPYSHPLRTKIRFRCPLNDGNRINLRFIEWKFFICINVLMIASQKDMLDNSLHLSTVTEER